MNDSPNRDVAVFTEALQLPRAERAAYLERACGSDGELRRRVEALLEGHDQLGDFLEHSPNTTSLPARAKVSAGEKPGDHIGRYRLLQQIGEGGCGVVFMAEQEEPVRRRVALKIIKPGMDTKSVIARFEAERQALALMDHPNIAKIFDAGATESGRPYFVMELVRGIKITEYCDQHSLTTQQRLKLFVQVCQAVQHAHQKGIIHRDIKPSNILVTSTEAGDALPVVIDFGIAKATTNQPLTDKTIFTAFEMLIGTPAYMSPEQAALTNVDMDTRTDIYSLGVLLYELLTGSTPFDTGELLKAGLDEIRRVIREQEPVRPSTRLSKLAAADLTTVAQSRHSEPPALIRAVHGDLDWIVMKALEKDRTRRYPTAHGLSLDVLRFLANEAVSARPPSRIYKLRKLVARNKLVFFGVALIFVLLVISLLTTTRWLMIERRANEQLQLYAEIARLESLGDNLHAQLKYTEMEEQYRKALDLRRKLPGDDTASAVLLDHVVEHFVSQSTFEKIRPLLAEYVDPAKFTRGEYRQVVASACNTLGQQGLWDDAEALAGQFQKSAPDFHYPYHARAPLLVLKGDVEEYRRLCGEIVSRFSRTTDIYTADRMAKDCLILPSAGVDLKAVAAMADLAVTKGKGEGAYPHFQCCKAMAEFRLDHNEEAVKWAQLAAQGGFDVVQAEAAAIVAMSQFKLKQLDKGRIALAECNKVIEEKLPKPPQKIGNDWRDWIIAHALRDEAEKLINGDTSPKKNPPK